MRIGQLARAFGLSRDTLLHYDAIGLLTPSARSDSGYREYAEADVERLRRICTYRAAGVPLAEIRSVLETVEPEGFRQVLSFRLSQLGEEIAQLQGQQRLIVRLLRPSEANEEQPMLNKDQWVALMRATGLTDDDMKRWHKEFEKMSGSAHEEFLVSLGIGAKEIAEIREWSRK